MRIFLKYFSIISSFLIASCISIGAEKTIANSPNIYTWKKSQNTALTISQKSYSDNWTGGEAGNIAWTALGNGTFEKQVSPIWNFRNTSTLQFRQTHQQDITAKHLETV